MDVLSYIAGALVFTLSTIFRYIVLRRSPKHGDRPTKPFNISSLEYPDDMLTALGQLMGIFWIAIGVFLTLTEEWLFSNFLGRVAELLILFLPFFARNILIWISIKVKSRM